MSREQQQQGGGEVARIREAIKLETQAMYNIENQFRQTGSHEIIHHWYKRINDYTEELKKFVGEEDAINIMIDAYNNVTEKH